MLPVIALVGRPNVGKSTLFNYLTRSRDALVADFPGLTRDRQYGYGRIGPGAYVVVDTGGLGGVPGSLAGPMREQTQRAIDEANHVLFLVDAREGLVPADEEIAARLRQSATPVTVLANKAEGQPRELALADFHGLGFADLEAVSATHGDNLRQLLAVVLESCSPAGKEVAAGLDPDAIRVAVIGRPNVGKSTLVNRLLGEDRVVTSEVPGTTRDAIFVPFRRDGQPYCLIDTAGVRRRARVSEAIEKFSVVKTLQAVDTANVVIAVLDARAGVADQDVTLLGLAVERGRALVVAVNKWDGLDSGQRSEVRRGLDRKLPFLEFARIHFISALHGTGVGDLPGAVDSAYAAAMRELPTAELTRVLEEAVTAHTPPLVHGRRIRLRYAHQGGKNPPLIVVHGNRTEKVPAAYRRYLANTFRRAFDLAGTPVRVSFRSGANPFAGRRNTLTPRQQRRRKRLIKHVKRK